MPRSTFASAGPSSENNAGADGVVEEVRSVPTNDVMEYLARRFVVVVRVPEEIDAWITESFELLAPKQVLAIHRSA